MASRVSKRHLTSLFPAGTSCFHPAPIAVRRFYTGSPVESENIDLDKWKSVLRSQAVSAVARDVAREARDEDETSEGPRGGEGDKLKALKDLVGMWREAGKLVPQEMTDEEMKIFSELTTKSSRKKYLKYLAIKEGNKRKDKEKQQKRREEREASLKQKEEQDGDEHRELKNTFLLQFWNRSLDRLLGWRSAQAMQFGQPLVIDMSYESNMSRRELENTVTQLLHVEGWNRRAAEPFHLHFCNLQQDGAYKKELLKRCSEETWNRLLVSATDRQHVDVFPRERLVYLTADSPNVLRKFDHSKVYIIGALVDRSIQSGLSMANAKRLKLATARLPLDEFLHWEIGAKNLTLDQMIRIMLSIKDTGKWEEALTFVPQRKHDGFHPQLKKTTGRGPRETNDIVPRSREQPNAKTFRSVDQSRSGPHRDSGRFTGMDRVFVPPKRERGNKPASKVVRTSFKSDMERRKGVSRIMFMDDE